MVSQRVIDVWCVMGVSDLGAEALAPRDVRRLEDPRALLRPARHIPVCIYEREPPSRNAQRRDCSISHAPGLLDILDEQLRALG